LRVLIINNPTNTLLDDCWIVADSRFRLYHIKFPPGESRFQWLSLTTDNGVSLFNGPLGQLQIHCNRPTDQELLLGLK